MAKQKEELIENKLKNPVYSEILFKINSREVDLTTLTKEFNKDRTTLVRQIRLLEEDQLIEKGKKVGKNQLYRINWNGFLEHYFNFIQAGSEKLTDTKIEKAPANYKNPDKNTLLVLSLKQGLISFNQNYHEQLTIEHMFGQFMTFVSLFYTSYFDLDEGLEEVKIFNEFVDWCYGNFFPEMTDDLEMELKINYSKWNKYDKKGLAEELDKCIDVINNAKKESPSTLSLATRKYMGIMDYLEDTFDERKDREIKGTQAKVTPIKDKTKALTGLSKKNGKKK